MGGERNRHVRGRKPEGGCVRIKIRTVELLKKKKKEVKMSFNSYRRVVIFP